MLIIKEVSGFIKASLEDAELYLGKAMKYHHDYPEVASACYETYVAHKDEVWKFHKIAVSLIEKSRKEHPIDSKVLEVMQVLWDFEHDYLMERMDKLDEKNARYLRLKSGK